MSYTDTMDTKQSKSKIMESVKRMRQSMPKPPTNRDTPGPRSLRLVAVQRTFEKSYERR